MADSKTKARTIATLWNNHNHLLLYGNVVLGLACANVDAIREMRAENKKAHFCGLCKVVTIVLINFHTLLLIRMFLSILIAS